MCLYINTRESDVFVITTVFIFMDIKTIINEELQSLNERGEGIYTIPELIQKLSVYGLAQEDLDVLQTVLFEAFQEGGDEKVIQTFRHFAGVDVDYISRGRYMFKSLVDPDKLQNFNKQMSRDRFA